MGIRGSALLIVLLGASAWATDPTDSPQPTPRIRGWLGRVGDRARQGLRFQAGVALADDGGPIVDMHTWD